MASVGGDGNRVGPGFNLPDEILSVIPTDPFDQLDLARKITSMAIASCVTNLETEAGSLRQKLLDKDRRIQELEDKVSMLESAYQDTELRLRIAQEDNMKLSKEKDSFALTAKKLSRDLAKLEAFKRQLMQSLNDENSPVWLLPLEFCFLFVVVFPNEIIFSEIRTDLGCLPHQQTETVDIGTYDQSVPKACSESGEEPNGYSTHCSINGSIDREIVNHDAPRQAGQGLSVTPYRTTQLTPTGTPRTITSVSPRWYSAAGSPQRTSGNASPRTQYEGWGGSLSSCFPSSQQSSTANSPPRGCPLAARTRFDGKEFFRQARSRLSLEQFSAFLSDIKELNAQRQSREETLRKAEEIFGSDNKDLYISFQRLLNRNTH